MNESSKKFTEINELIELALDGSTTPEQSQQLNDLIINNPTVRRYYCEYIHLTVGIERLSVKIPATDLQEYNIIFDQELWSQLAHEEMIAPAIEIPVEPRRELVQKVVYPSKEKRKLSKFSIFTLVNVAAVILFLLILKFAPVNSGIEVATLTDSIDAKWADIDASMQTDTRLVTSSDKLMLREGLVELTFDNRAKAIIEAPAEFQILAEDRIGLTYGKVYTTVPKEAIGFSVYTSNAKIVDIGTEFGVEAEPSGNTKLHVLKGKTLLMAGKKDAGIGMEVGKGVGKKVSGTTQAITDIPLNESLFARAFDSKKKVIWRQQPSLDLADVVRSGNGQGTGNSDVRLRPTKGLTKEQSSRFSTAKGYRLIPELDFIDGIFVPDGQTEQIISSRGDVFAECPATSGIFDCDLIGNPEPGLFKTPLREGTMLFNGQMYANGGKSCILMHTNLGLTFDLDAIRNSYQRSITRFTSQAGIADLKEDYFFNADFWVLVDGEVRYSLQQYREKGVLNNISVVINDEDRFLTLVTTDGGDPDDPGHFYTRSISCDWCVFTEPILVME